MKPTFREQLIHIGNSPSTKWVVLLFTLAFIPRLLWAFADHPRPFSDMEDYYLCAINFLKGGYLAQSPDRLAYRAPMYPLFLSFCLRTFPGNPLLMIRIVQSLLGNLSALLVFWVTLKIIRKYPESGILFPYARYGECFAFIIGLLYAWMAYPIFFCSIFMTETFFIFLLLGWILWSLYLKRGSSVWNVTAFSVLLGAMALTRPISLFFLPVLAIKVYECFPQCKSLRISWIPLVAWALPILPWTIRNILLFHTFVLISTNSGVNLFIGQNPTFGYYESGYKEVIRREYIKEHGPNEVGEDRLFLRLGLEQIAKDPKAALVRGGWKFYFLYLLDKEPWPWEEFNQGAGLRFVGGLEWPNIHWKPWFLIFALLGIVYARIRGLNHGIMLSVIGCYTLACMFFFARTRFRMPLEPLLTIYAGLGILSLVEWVIWGYGKRICPKGTIDS